MSNTTVAQELDRIEMAQAYKAITQAMGPSPQLLSFVNYQTASVDNNFGLESFDIMDQHNAVLTNVDAMDFDALESLIDQEANVDDSGTQELFQLGNELDQLGAFQDVIAQFGMTKSTYALLKSTDLLATTSHDTIAIEMIVADGSDATKHEAAMESIADSIKEKAAAWSARLVEVIKKIRDVTFTPIVEKITNGVNALSAKIENTNLGREIKAHPYRSAIAIMGSIAAAAGVIAFIGNKLTTPDVKLDLVFKDALNQLKKAHPSLANDFDSVTITMNNYKARSYFGARSFRRPVNSFGEVETATLDKLGWTKSSLVTFSHKLGGLTNVVSQAISTFVRGATKFAMGLKDIVGTEALNIPGTSKRQSHKIVTSLYWMVYRLIKTKVGPGYHHLAAMILRMLGH